MASRKEEKERRRRERLERERAQQREAQRKRLYGIVAGGVLALAAVGALVAAFAAGGGGDSSSGSSADASSAFDGAIDPPPQRISDLKQAAIAADCVLKNPPIEGRLHVKDSTPVKYNTTPPTSGNHNPVPAADGVYGKAPGVRHYVHTLEHGRVEIQYKPGTNPRRVKQLGGLFNEDPYHMLMFPNAKMPYRVAFTAWGHLAGCKKVDDATFDVLRAFRDRYRDTAPEQVQ
jgi:Protein of unknown function (DUF3105)